MCRLYFENISFRWESLYRTLLKVPENFSTPENMKGASNLTLPTCTEKYGFDRIKTAKFFAERIKGDGDLQIPILNKWS